MGKLKKKSLDGNIETFLLSILQAGPSYGYAILQDLNKLSEGVLVLGEGTIYPVLHRLEDKGLISSYWHDAENGRRRKYYRLTSKGKKAHADNKVEWLKLKKVMENVLETKPA